MTDYHDRMDRIAARSAGTAEARAEKTAQTIDSLQLKITHQQEQIDVLLTATQAYKDLKEHTDVLLAAAKTYRDFISGGGNELAVKYLQLHEENQRLKLLIGTHNGT